MKNKKGNILVITSIVVVVAITAGIIGYIFAQKTQKSDEVKIDEQKAQTAKPVTQLDVDDLSDWQTYSDKEYGFSIKYPKSYELKMSKEYGVSFGPIGFSAPAPLSIISFKPTLDISLDFSIDSGMKTSSLKDCNKTILNNKPAYECLSLAPVGPASPYYIVSFYNGYEYGLSSPESTKL